MSLSKIPLAGVIGSPIAHSKSPQLHQHWLKTYGLQGFYIPMDVSPANLREVLAKPAQNGICWRQSNTPSQRSCFADC